jgi:AbrB family looped-hinge helix DNA binding protein
MAKVTSKLQVTVPKALAERHGISAGDEIDWQSAGDAIRIVPVRVKPRRERTWRARLFDQATERQGNRQKKIAPVPSASGRDWTRDELYDRGRPR